MPYKITTRLITIILLMVPVVSNANESDADRVDDLGLFQQGVQLSANGKWSNAEAIFRGIAERNPSWPEAKNNLAVALYNSGKLEQSHRAFEAAVTSLPSFRIAQINRQRLYDYSATLAYNRAIGNNEKPGLPTLEMLNDVEDISSIIEKTNPEVANNDEIFEQVKDSLHKWSKSWTNSNVEQYLAAYSNDFTPAGDAKNFSQWSEQRSAKLRKGKIDQISLDSIQVYINDDKKQALAEFIQDYKSRNYQDKVVKQMRLAYKNNRWLITSEEVLRVIK